MAAIYDFVYHNGMMTNGSYTYKTKLLITETAAQFTFNQDVKINMVEE